MWYLCRCCTSVLSQVSLQLHFCSIKLLRPAGPQLSLNPKNLTKIHHEVWRIGVYWEKITYPSCSTMLINWINALLQMLGNPWEIIIPTLVTAINQLLMSVDVKIGKTKVHQTILQIFILNFFSAVWHNAQQSTLFGIFGNQAPSNVQHNSQLLKDGSEWKMANLFKHCLSVSVKLLSGLLHATLSIWRPPILRPLRL